MPDTCKPKTVQQSSLRPLAHTGQPPSAAHPGMGTALDTAILSELVVGGESWSLGVPMLVTTKMPGLEGGGNTRAVPGVIWGMQATLSP